MNTQPTPETDAEHARFPMGGFTLDFARKLERERDEWKALTAQYSAERDAAQDELVRLTDTKRPSRETSNKLDLTP